MLFVKNLVSVVGLVAGLASSAVAAVGGQTINNTILILARSAAEATSAYSGLQGYGIPYQVLIVPQAGIALPTLNSTATSGNYGGFIILSEVSYDYSGNWTSALTASQFNQLYAYQNAFNVRMVRLDVYPDTAFGTTTAIPGTGCCASTVEQSISFTNSTGFATANLKTGATMSTLNMYHYPATITNTSTTWQVAKFSPDANGQFTSDTTAAVINSFKSPNRQQMVFFTSWATDWSATSNFLQHAYIHWMTRGLFLGARKVYLNTQVDDVHLSTDLYSPSGSTFRLRPEDLTPHVTWMTALNKRLPSGSKYWIELGHNGNGDIINATNIEYSATKDICSPVDAIYYDGQAETTLEFQKPLGSGTDQWPATPTSYTWSSACAKIDRLASWFMTASHRDAFSHVSHTFTHENMDNATYNDANKEIYFNVAWLNQTGISAGTFSPNGIIPPAITGLHNGDAINAWMTNNITMVVGDNSRPVLMNPTSNFWPLITNVSTNGYAGLTVIPRWPTTIYYNCDLPACTTQEWIDTSAGSGGFANLLNYERTTTSRYLLGLRQDPYMFHQANMRAVDVPGTTVGTVSVNSLLQIWVETVTQEMTRLTAWPILSAKHDDIGRLFLARMARDACNPALSYTWSASGSTITAVTVSAPGNGNKCSTPIPVTFPSTTAPKFTGTATSDKVGTDPLIMWATLSGSPVTFTLATPVAA